MLWEILFDYPVSVQVYDSTVSGCFFPKRRKRTIAATDGDRKAARGQWEGIIDQVEMKDTAEKGRVVPYFDQK